MFDKYKELIKELDSFEKENILSKKFELYSDNKNIIKIYYAPHNEIINQKAKIFIVGITPGWTQTQIAYKTAHEGLVKNLNSEQIRKNCKVKSRFAGSMRKNIIEMLDELELNRYLKISSCSELFDYKNELLHTTSLIPYPIFINNKNYTGSNPSILENEVFVDYVKRYFYKETENFDNILIIPLGKAVEEVLKMMINENIIYDKQCLFGFPHPSGANGHRKKQFEERKGDLKEKIKIYFQINKY